MDEVANCSLMRDCGERLLDGNGASFHAEREDTVQYKDKRERVGEGFAEERSISIGFYNPVLGVADGRRTMRE